MQPQWHFVEEDFFRDLSVEKREFLLRSVRRPLKKHDAVFSEDEPANSCYYLREGSVKISRITSWGKEPIIFVRMAGEMFGLAEVIDGKKRKCNARAISPGILHEIKRKDFEDLLSRHYPLVRRVIEVLGRRVRFLAEQIENLIVSDVPTRLLKLFVYLCYPQLINLDSVDSPILIPVSLTQEQLAACTGSCQQTISETMKLMQEDGLIQVSKKQITILKPLEIMDRLLQ